MEPNGIVATFECFDTTTLKWTSLPDMPHRRHSHSMVALPSPLYNDIIILGGEESDGMAHVTPVTFTCYRYNITTKLWLSWINLPAVSGLVTSLFDNNSHMIMLISRYGCYQLPLDKQSTTPTPRTRNAAAVNGNKSGQGDGNAATAWIPMNDVVEFGVDSAIVTI
jgi:hypothetical protein